MYVLCININIIYISIDIGWSLAWIFMTERVISIFNLYM